MTKKQIELLAKLYLAYKLDRMHEDGDFHEVFSLRLEGYPSGITVEEEEEVYSKLLEYSQALSGNHIRFNSIEEIYKYVINE